MLEKIISNDSLNTEQISLLEQLLRQADSQGYLLIDDLIVAMPELETNIPLLEDILIYAFNQDIKIYSDAEEAEKRKKPSVSPKNGSQQPDDTGFQPDEFDLSTLPPDDILNLYLKEMATVPLLTFEQERNLAKQIEKGLQARRKLKTITADSPEAQQLRIVIRRGNEARSHLIRANTRLVVSIAKKYKGYGVPFTDLIQEGNLGLIKAISKFDYHRGYKFSTYATWWIRQSVTRALASQGRTIRIPVHMNDRLRKLQQTSRRLEQVEGRKPTPEELAREMNMEPAQVQWMLRSSRHPISLELPLGEEKDSELGDFIEDGETPPPTDVTYHHLLREELEDALSTLPAREARILRLRFGLQNGETYSLAEVGEKLGLTRERIRQLEKQALRRLRHPRRSRGLRDYLS